MKRNLLAVFLAGALLPLRSQAATPSKEEPALFQTAVDLFKDSRSQKTAAVEAFERFLKQYPNSSRSADAQFMAGESYFHQALDLLKSGRVKRSAPAGTAPQNDVVQVAFNNARQAYKTVLSKYGHSGLGPTAQYRLGEVEYNQQRWANAIAEFTGVHHNYPRSYIAPDSLIGIIFADLALEDFPSATSNLYTLGESYPNYLKVPAVLFAQGIISLHKADYSAAEQAFSQVSSPEALFYLGKTYLLSSRPYLAANTFERLIRDYPDSELLEEADFFNADSFFLSRDYDGAMTKYQRFVARYPDSPLRGAALYRIGSVNFEKKNFQDARVSYQSLVDRYPQDEFAPLAQYAIAESYLAAGQKREALFGYSKVLTQFPRADTVVPLATYKLAWAQSQMGNFSQAAQTCRGFLASYPNHPLSKNVYLILGNVLSASGEISDAVTSWQRIVDIAPGTEVGEQAMFLILQAQYQQKNYGSILTSYQFLIRRLPPSQSKWRSLSYLYAADAYLALNHVDEAQAVYEMILKVYPTETTAVYAQDGIAWCYTYRGDDARAVEERKKLKDILAVASSTSVPVGRNELGIADNIFNQKMFEDAYPLYEKFAANYPSAPEAPTALYRAGMSLYHLRYYSQAVDVWQKLSRDYPNSTEAKDAAPQIADTLFRTGKYAQATQAYRGLVSKSPDGPQAALARLRIAHAAFNNKEDAAALREASALIDHFPESHEANDALDIMEAVFDRSPSLKYQETLSAIVAAHPHTHVAAEVQFRLARRLYEKKQFAKAAAEFQRFSVDYTDAPQLAKAQFMLAESLLQIEQYPKAVSAYQRLLNNFPRSADTPLALFHAATAHYKLKEYEGAVANYERLVEEYPDSQFVKPSLFNMALSLKTLGKLDNAQDAYTKYARLVGIGDPSALAALWEVFAIQKENKAYDGALDTLRMIQSSAKGSPGTGLEVLYRMGEIYALMGREDEAVSTFKQLKAKGPASNAFRLQGLIKLGDMCEKTEPACAISAYEDLARNSPNRKVAQAARERASALRSSFHSKSNSRSRGGGGSRKGKASPKKEDSDDASN